MCSKAYRRGSLAGDAISPAIPIPGPGKLRAARTILHAAEDAGRARKIGHGLDGLYEAGKAGVRGGRTAAGRAYQQHMGRGELGKVPGRQLDRAGQDLLDDILTDPRSRVVPVTRGGAAGGVRVIRPDGTGVTFRRDGTLAYFGVGY